MKLPIPFLKDKTETNDYYLALLLSDEKTSAVIMETKVGKVEILNQQTVEFTDSIEDLPLNDLIGYIDKVISTAEEVLPSHIQTHKTIFGVKENWIESETKKIKKTYLAKLKKVCDSLDLTPLGFMVISEAIAHLLAEEEGAPLSAILAEIGQHRIDLSLFRGGKVVEKINGKMLHSPVETVDALLKHFITPVLPARIVISDTDKGEELSQQFIAFQWSKSLPFLHVPQTMVLPKGFDCKSIVFGAAQQMGFTGTEIIETTPMEPADKKTLAEENEFQQVGTVPQGQPTTADPSQNPFGFVMEQDIAEVQPLSDAKFRSVSLMQKESEEYVPPLPGQESAGLRVVDTQQTESEYPEEASSNTEMSHGGRKNLLAGIRGFIADLHFPKPQFSFFRKGNIWLKICLPILVIIILLAGIVYFYLSRVKTTIILSVSPKLVTQSADVTFSATSGNDFANNTIAAKPVTTSVDGQLSESASGAKDVGDRARGTVTIYNNSDSSQELSSGTTVTANNGMSFTVDNDVTVASASGDIFSGTKPGTTDTTVTASDIGEEYNLPSDTTFSVSGNDSLAAKNATAFSGGTKKIVTVVSQSDLTKLKTDLIKQLEQNATNQLTKQSSGTQTVLPVVINESLTKATFDYNIGDQASKVQISGTLTFSGLAYAADDINQFAETFLKNKYSQSIIFANNSIKTTVNDAKEKDANEVSASIDFQAGLLPKIDSDSVAQSLHGKSLAAAKATVMQLPQVNNTDFEFSPNIPLLPSFFPRLPNKISVVIKPEI